MNTPMQGADWSVLRDHLPFYASLLFSLPPVSFVLIKVVLAARSAAKQKGPKQWCVEPNRDEAQNASSSAAQVRSQDSNQRGVHELLRSIEMMRAEAATEDSEPAEAPVIDDNPNEVAQPVYTFERPDCFEPVCLVESIEPTETPAAVEAPESMEMAESAEGVEASAAMESIEAADTVDEPAVAESTGTPNQPAVAEKPHRPCRSRRISSRASRSQERARRREDSRRRQ